MFSAFQSAVNLGAKELEMREIGKRYKIVSKIGAGGMGTVYKAIQTNLNRVVALKTISKKALNDQEWTQRFFLEAEIMANLPDNNHVVHVFDMEKEGDLPFYAMEYIPHSLARHVGEYGPQDETRVRKSPRKLSVKEACAIAESILEALVFVHKHGVIHRDISPENVLLIMKDKKFAAAKLTDFGIAKAVDSGLTTVDTSAYKFGYAAPEQKASLASADERSDIFSFGMVLYRMVIGELPSGVHTSEPMRSNPEICSRLNSWILKATKPNPDHRYQSAEEALSKLRDIGPGFYFGQSLTASLLRFAPAFRQATAYLRTKPRGINGCETGEAEDLPVEAKGPEEEISLNTIEEAPDNETEETGEGGTDTENDQKKESDQTEGASASEDILEKKKSRTKKFLFAFAAAFFCGFAYFFVDYLVFMGLEVPFLGNDRATELSDPGGANLTVFDVDSKFIETDEEGLIFFNKWKSEK